MLLKLIGAVLIMVGCGSIGLLICAGYRAEEGCLRDLHRVLEFMECELSFRLTPLPELCQQAASNAEKLLKDVFLKLSQELESQVSADPQCSMRTALAQSKRVPQRTRNILDKLGCNLGKFDIEGQILGLQSLKMECKREIGDLNEHRIAHLRSYQTLSLCAGAALSILFL